MTKAEAISAMSEGKKVTHRFFSNKEWMTVTKDGKIETEEGYQHNRFEFWKYRTGHAWEDGYSLYEG